MSAYTVAEALTWLVSAGSLMFRFRAGGPGAGWFARFSLHPALACPSNTTMDYSYVQTSASGWISSDECRHIGVTPNTTRSKPPAGSALNWLSGYPPNSVLTWLLKVPVGSRVDIFLDTIDTEEPNFQAKDVLRVYNGANAVASAVAAEWAGRIRGANVTIKASSGGAQLVPLLSVNAAVHTAVKRHTMPCLCAGGSLLTGSACCACGSGNVLFRFTSDGRFQQAGLFLTFTVIHPSHIVNVTYSNSSPTGMTMVDCESLVFDVTQPGTPTRGWWSSAYSALRALPGVLAAGWLDDA